MSFAVVLLNPESSTALAVQGGDTPDLRCDILPDEDEVRL